MSRYETVAIVGVGLIGGSIGLALRGRGLARNVVGIGRRQASLRIARRAGCVTSTTIDLAKGVTKADLVVVATPVGRIVEDVQAAARHAPAGTLITDAGSTKGTIVDALDGQLDRDCRFLGSHPLAGGEKSGPSHAAADLFAGKVAIITPTRHTRAEDFDHLEAFWSGLGSVVIQMSAAEHDKAMAVTSHLPHLVAAAVAAAVPEAYFRLAGTGVLDTTRVAAGDVGLWKQIFDQNRANVLAALDAVEKNLAALRAGLRQADLGDLERILTLAKKNRDALGS